MADFSLNEDQIQIQKWVHDFADKVIRPAAHEWDEREEFPYPVVKEAAKIGLYGWEFLMNTFADPSGLTLPVAIEELFWGDAGIGMAIMGSALAAARQPGRRRPRAGRASDRRGNTPPCLKGGAGVACTRTPARKARRKY